MSSDNWNLYPLQELEAGWPPRGARDIGGHHGADGGEHGAPPPCYQCCDVTPVLPIPTVY